MTLLGLVEQFLGPLFRELVETDLHRFVAVGLGGLHLGDGAGARFDDGDRHQTSVGDENLRHADLLAENCLFHGYTSIRIVHKPLRSLLGVMTL